MSDYFIIIKMALMSIILMRISYVVFHYLRKRFNLRKKEFNLKRKRFDLRRKEKIKKLNSIAYAKAYSDKEFLAFLDRINENITEQTCTGVYDTYCRDKIKKFSLNHVIDDTEIDRESFMKNDKGIFVFDRKLYIFRFYLTPSVISRYSSVSRFMDEIYFFPQWASYQYKHDHSYFKGFSITTKNYEVVHTKFSCDIGRHIMPWKDVFFIDDMLLLLKYPRLYPFWSVWTQYHAENGLTSIISKNKSFEELIKKQCSDHDNKSWKDIISYLYYENGNEVKVFAKFIYRIVDDINNLTSVDIQKISGYFQIIFVNYLPSRDLAADDRLYALSQLSKQIKEEKGEKSNG